MHAKTKHTPGNWMIVDGINIDYYEGEEIATISSNDKPIARICSQNSPHVDADRYLMVAAPDMIDALIAVQSAYANNAGDVVFAKAMDKVNKAIRKATNNYE